LAKLTTVRASRNNVYRLETSARRLARWGIMLLGQL